MCKTVFSPCSHVFVTYKNTFSIRYDPLAGLPTDTDTEQDRVIFIKSIAQFMVRKLVIRICELYICSTVVSYGKYTQVTNTADHLTITLIL